MGVGRCRSKQSVHEEHYVEKHASPEKQEPEAITFTNVCEQKTPCGGFALTMVKEKTRVDGVVLASCHTTGGSRTTCSRCK